MLPVPARCRLARVRLAVRDPLGACVDERLNAPAGKLDAEGFPAPCHGAECLRSQSGDTVLSSVVDVGSMACCSWLARIVSGLRGSVTRDGLCRRSAHVWAGSSTGWPSAPAGAPLLRSRASWAALLPVGG